MTQLERLMAVFENKHHDTLPCFCDLSHWVEINSRFNKANFPTQYDNKELIDIYKDLGCGMRQELLSPSYRVKNNRVEKVKKIEKDKDGVVTKEKTQWHTPIGTISQVRVFSKISYSSSWQEYAVKSVQDLKILRFIREDEEIIPDFAMQTRRIEKASGQGVVSSLPRRSPVPRLIVEWMGVEHFFYALADYPEEVDKTIDVLSESDDPIFRTIENAPAPLVIFDDNITGELVSPALFKKYYIPYYKKRARQMHIKGKYVYAHIDGKFKHILPLVERSEIDCAQALTPAPLGDVPVEKMRGLAGSELVLWGGIPAIYSSRNYPRYLFEDLVRRCIQRYRSDPRFILGVEDQIPPDADLTRIKFVTELVEG